MIQINENITYKGITVNGAVMIINAVIRKNGSSNELIAAVGGIYVNDEARQQDEQGNKLPHAFPETLRRSYDRSTEDTDILLLAHNMYKDWLTTVPDPENNVTGGNFEVDNVNIIL